MQREISDFLKSEAGEPRTASIRKKDKHLWEIGGPIQETIKSVYLANGNKPYCPSKYQLNSTTTKSNSDLPAASVATSTKRKPNPCTAIKCKENPNCLNHVGLDRWLNDEAFNSFCESNGLDLFTDPKKEYKHNKNLPTGLKNLGGTCYLNTLLQILYHTQVFKDAVYSYNAPISNEIVHELQTCFANMEYSTRSYYNPENFVKCLGLNPTIQQDPQEFSKLFITKMQQFFRFQDNKNIQNVILENFSGKRTYVTECNNCGRKSPRNDTFFELELNIGDSLEDSLRDYLKHDIIDKENQYFCEHCQGKQDAQRYITIDSLPPVLHIQLLRFVYNVNTGKRKKLTTEYKYPSTIELSPYVNSGKGSMIYELTAVINHEGAEATSGHFVADILKDDFWINIDDEVAHCGGDYEEEDKETSKKEVETAKDLDWELNSSKTAYILVYTRKPLVNNDVQLISSSSKEIIPPNDIVSKIFEENEKFDLEILKFKQKKDELKISFEMKKEQVMNICKVWNVSSDDESFYYISAETLSNWLLTTEKEGCKPACSGEVAELKSVKVLDNKELVCSHGKMNPTKVYLAKKISMNAVLLLLKYGYTFEPTLTQSSTCSDCVNFLLNDQRSNNSHQMHSEKLRKLVDLKKGGTKYWISKRWWNDWKKKLTSDPPNSPEYSTDVTCVHDKLIPQATNRRLVSNSAYQYLCDLFHDFQTLSEDEVECSICFEAVNESKAANIDKIEGAQEEKYQLKRIFDLKRKTVLFDSTTEPGYVLPKKFLEAWRSYVKYPEKEPRPTAIQTELLICQTHQKFVHWNVNFKGIRVGVDDAFIYDNCILNQSEDEFILVTELEWEYLSSMYKIEGPTISFQLSANSSADSSTLIKWTPDLCENCWTLRKLDFVETTIFAKLVEEEKPVEEVQSKKVDDDIIIIDDEPVVANTNKRKRVTRDRRGKTKKGSGTRPVSLKVCKADSVKDLKVMILRELGISPICQTLKFRDTILDDNDQTIHTLNVLPSETIYVVELKEQDYNDFEIDGFDGGFAGTGLLE